MLKKITGISQEDTHNLIEAKIEFLDKKDKERGRPELPEDKKFDRAVKFINCEKTRIQNRKMYVEIIARIASPVLYLIAMFFAVNKH